MDVLLSERRERFAEAILRVLEYDPNPQRWSSYTLDLIGEAAVNNGLAEEDGSGDFEITEGAIR